MFKRVETFIKACTKCGHLKDSDQFYKSSRTDDGLQYRCKSCCNEYGKKYYEAHNGPELKARKAAVDSARYSANADRMRERRRLAYRANKDREAAYYRAYSRANPDKMSRKYHARRARITGSGGSYTVAEWRDKLTLYGGCCIYCGEAKKLTIDHKVPLFRGGSNSIENLVPSCGECNSRKGTKTAHEFVRSLDKQVKA